jgi:hypothetical protein
MYFTQQVREEADKTIYVCGPHYGVETFTQGIYVHSPLNGDDSIMKTEEGVFGNALFGIPQNTESYMKLTSIGVNPCNSAKFLKAQCREIPPTPCN